MTSDAPRDKTSLSPAEKRERLAELLRRKARETTIEYPLSHGQRALWFLHRMAPESPAYNTCLAVRLAREVEDEHLLECLRELQERHRALRTRFVGRDGEILQSVPGRADLDFRREALGDLDAPAVQARLVGEHRMPFDLRRDPLFRAVLFACSDGERYLLLRSHHIVTDGLSMGILLEDLEALYDAKTGRRLDPLPAIEGEFEDHIRRQNAMAGSAEGEEHLEFWRAELAGGLPVLEFPTDRLRSPEQRFRGESVRLEFDERLRGRLESLARERNASLFVVLMAGVQALLHRYTGQEDIVLGAPTAGRSGAQFSRTVGYFVNPVAVRGDLSGDPSFAESIERLKSKARAAMAHQDYPFPLVVERLHTRRDTSRSPIFQAVFNYQQLRRLGFDDARREASLDSGSPFTVVPIIQNEGQFDLAFDLGDAGRSLLGSIKYDSDLFEFATIERLAKHFENLLQSAAEQPEARISELAMLGEDERRRQLYDWNRGRDVPAPRRCIHELFEARAHASPERIALTFRNETMGYGELNRRANRLAHRLRALGVGPESIVGLCVRRSMEMVVALLGILKAGGAYLPIDAAHPEARLKFMIEDAGARCLVTDRDAPGGLAGAGIERLCLHRDAEQIEAGCDADPESGAAPGNAAYIIYTSGSTGTPKGCIVEHRNVVRLFDATQPDFGFNEEDVWTLFHSVAFDFSVWEIWGALFYGGRLVVVPGETARSPHDFYRLVADENATVLNQTPGVFRQFIRADAAESRPLALRHVIFGGEALELESLRPWFERRGDRVPRLVNMYGITETTVHATLRPLSMSDLDFGRRSVIGRPLADLQIYILDRNLRPVPIGAAGEICVGGGGVARGYLNRPDLTRGRFVPDPFAGASGAPLYRSGDLARYLPDGDIEYLGRIDDQVKIRGYRIELGEIEAELQKCAGVQECAVLARRESATDCRLTAYLVAAPEAVESVNALRDRLLRRLPDYMVPAEFVRLDALPLTPNGKVDRRALIEKGGEKVGLDSDRAAPRNEIERQVAQIWREVLKVERFGVNDNFFDLGGHSMLVIEVHRRLQSLAANLSVVDLFRYPTVAALAARIGGDGASDGVLSESRDRAERRRTALRRRSANTRKSKT